MKYLVFDLELTGDEPGWHEIIQIGACLFDEKWNKLGTFLSNVYPENEESFSLPSAEIHGLTLADLDSAPMMHEVIEDFENWIVNTLLGERKWQAHQKPGALRNVLLCGQSVHYDVNFLRYAYREEHLEWPYSHKTIDLYQLSFYLFKILRRNGVDVPKSLSLTAVADYFGFERESDIHNALEDSILTGLCLHKVLDFADKFRLEE